MTIMSFFCLLLNGRCATELPEPKTRETPKTPSANMTAAASTPPVSARYDHVRALANNLG